MPARRAYSATSSNTSFYRRSENRNVSAGSFLLPLKLYKFSTNWSSLSLVTYWPWYFRLIISFFSSLPLKQISEPRLKCRKKGESSLVHIVFPACNELCRYSKIFVSWGILQVSSQARMQAAKCKSNNQKSLTYAARDGKRYHKASQVLQLAS